MPSAASTHDKRRAPARRHSGPDPEPRYGETVAREPSRELVSEFVWLPYGAPSTFDTAHVVRVRVPRAVLSSMGLAVDARDLSELVHADVVVGGDGMARAIRLVQASATVEPFE